MFKKILLFMIITAFIAGFSSMKAGELKGVKMEDSIEVEGKKLVLNGMALRKKFIFKVYVAGLYLPEKEKDAEKILKTDAMRHIIMHFLRSVSKKKLNDAWYDGLEDNTPDHSPELKKQFDRLTQLMESVKSKDRIIFTYIPEKGTSVSVKGKIVGNIEGKAFADALFA